MNEQAQHGAVGMVDTWTKFVTFDLPAEIERMRKKPMDLSQLQVEMHSTVLHALLQVADWLVKMRDDVYERLSEYDVELEAVNERIEDVDTSTGDTQLTTEDAEAIGKLAGAAKLFAEDKLRSTKDPAAVAKLQEVISIADYCSTMASEKVLVDEPDENEEEGGSDQSVVVDGVAEVGGANG